MTDAELIERVRSGDTNAFGELVERHRGAVYRAALAALGNAADAEDVAQDALVLAFRKLNQFRGDASVKTWMISITWRVALSRRRRPLWRLRQMISGAEAVEFPASEWQSPERQMLTMDFFESVKRHIRQLSPKLRDALLLTAAGDLTQDEIAAAVNIPAATFRGRVREARMQLKARLRSEGR